MVTLKQKDDDLDFETHLHILCSNRPFDWNRQHQHPHPTGRLEGAGNSNRFVRIVQRHISAYCFIDRGLR